MTKTGGTDNDSWLHDLLGTVEVFDVTVIKRSFLGLDPFGEKGTVLVEVAVDSMRQV